MRFSQSSKVPKTPLASWFSHNSWRHCGGFHKSYRVPHDLLTGSMSIDERYEAMAAFKQQQSPRALLISLRAGGVGLNLGNATHVVLFDRWWNPAVEAQAIFRAHRFEREVPLHVVRFLVHDTVEEHIAQILGRKANLFEEVVESVDTRSYHFTREELMRILELVPEDLPQGNEVQLRYS